MMHAAISTIGVCFRAVKAKEKYLTAKAVAIGNIKNESAIVLQRLIMSWTKWHIFKRYKTDKRARMTYFAVTKFQALIRGFTAHRRHWKSLAANAEKRTQKVKEWSAIDIQKVAYIARKTIIKSYRVRNSLSESMLALAERYLKTGDLWGLLKEVDDKFARSRSELADHKARENDWPETFIKKVVERRENEFDSAWNRFLKRLHHLLNLHNQQQYRKVLKGN